MSRRKILLLSGVPALIAIGLGFYVPRYFSPIPGLIEELRSCLEPTDEEASSAQADVEPRQCIRLEIVHMMVNLGKTRMPLLADRENDDQVVRRVVTNRDRMLAAMHQLRRQHCLANVSEPTMLTLSGAPDTRAMSNATQVAKIVSQLPGAIGILAPGAIDGSVIELRGEKPIVQPLILVTMGDETAEVHQVVEAAAAAGKSL